MNLEKTFAMIKPNAVKKHVIGQILARYESKGLKIVAAKFEHITPQKAEGFYAEHKEKPFFGSLIQFITSSPVLLLTLEGANAVDLHRQVIGATDPKKAAEGTIRKDFGDSIDENAVHGSDSVTSAQREIAYFFKTEEIVHY